MDLICTPTIAPPDPTEIRSLKYACDNFEFIQCV